MAKNILVTGANGFIGKALIHTLSAQMFNVIAGVRRESPTTLPAKQLVLGDLSTSTNHSADLQDIDVIIHLAARVHIMQDMAANPLTEFRKTNTSGTLNLALQAAQAGVKRFIFISTIKVNGESTTIDCPFQAEITDPPSDSYAQSKYQAEHGLLSLAKNTGMEVVIIRPPLVYGPGVKANFAVLINYLLKNVPLPLGMVNNKRSLVALDNLVDFIILCSTHSKAANEIFLISDGEDVSTTQLLHKIANVFNKKAFLLPVPTKLMHWAARLIGKQELSERLLSSLTVDNAKAKDLLAWHPVITMDQQLKKIANTYK